MNLDLALRLAWDFSPLMLLLLGAVRRDRFPNDTGLFARQPWTTGDAVVVLAIFLGSFWLDAIPALQGVPQLHAYLLVASFRDLLVLGAVYGLLRGRYGVPITALGVQTRFSGYYLFWALKVATMFFLLAGGVLVVLAGMGGTTLAIGTDPGHPMAGSMLAAIANDGATALLMWLAAGVEFGILGPIAEEVVFRGVLGAPLARKYGPAGAAVLSSVIFALGHTSHILNTLSSLVVGVVYMFLYMRSQSLLPSVYLHIIGNSTGFVSRYIVRSFERPAAFLLPGLALIGLMAVVSSVATRRTRPSRSTDRLPWS